MLEKAFGDLHADLMTLRASLRTVQVTAAHDEKVTAELRELVADLDGVLLTVDKARNACRLPLDVDIVRRNMPACQRQLSLLKARFLAGLNTPEKLTTLRAQGREDVAAQIARCAVPLAAADWAISVCWAKLGEYAVLNPGGGMPGFLPPGL